MRNIFNTVMRIVSSLVGVLMVALGGVWMLQGLNLAFKVGFMVGDPKWTLYGAILAAFGVAQVVWSNTRQARGLHPSFATFAAVSGAGVGKATVYRDGSSASNWAASGGGSATLRARKSFWSSSHGNRATRSCAFKR